MSSVSFNTYTAIYVLPPFSTELKLCITCTSIFKCFVLSVLPYSLMNSQRKMLLIIKLITLLNYCIFFPFCLCCKTPIFKYLFTFIKKKKNKPTTTTCKLNNHIKSYYENIKSLKYIYHISCNCLIQH